MTTRRTGTAPAVFLFAALAVVSGTAVADDFATAQNQATRVKTARAEKDAIVRELFAKAGVDYPAPRLFFRAFKKEREVEVWAGNKKGPLSLIKRYPVCASSGDLGPKRELGDLQVPEGVYVIDRFNAVSNFYLSLGVSYPNASDRILGRKGRLGGDIFVHGDCVTIGCLPLTDELIKEVYLIALDARINGLFEIPIHIFPLRMDEAGLNALKEIAGDDGELWRFWQNLAPVFVAFENEKTVPRVRVNGKTGAYELRR